MSGGPKLAFLFLINTRLVIARVMMLVKAGSAVDAFIDQLIPYLEKGDIIIDGGNSEYTDSQVGVVTVLMLGIRVHSLSLSLSVAARPWRRRESTS